MIEVSAPRAARPRKLIVAVDDDLRVRESIESLLESAGYDPLLFASGGECLRSGSLSHAECLITDVRLPEMDGIELQRRARCERPGLPVIFISAYYEEEIRRRAVEGGALRFFHKPFSGRELLEAIDGISGVEEGTCAE